MESVGSPTPEAFVSSRMPRLDIASIIFDKEEGDQSSSVSRLSFLFLVSSPGLCFKVILARLPKYLNLRFNLRLLSAWSGVSKYKSRRFSIPFLTRPQSPREVSSDIFS